jgi:hypothetical protein
MNNVIELPPGMYFCDAKENRDTMCIESDKLGDFLIMLASNSSKQGKRVSSSKLKEQ